MNSCTRCSKFSKCENTLKNSNSEGTMICYESVDQKVDYYTGGTDEEPALRDKFAMAALTGVLSGSVGSWFPSEAASAAYKFADAMIMQRSKNDCNKRSGNEGEKKDDNNRSVKDSVK